MIKPSASTSNGVNIIGGGPRKVSAHKQTRVVVSPTGEKVTVTTQNAFDLVRIHGYVFESAGEQAAISRNATLPPVESVPDAPPGSTREVVQTAERAPDKTVQAALDNLEGLRARATELNIKFGQTWGVKRLLAAIEEAEAEAKPNPDALTGENQDNG